MRGGELFEKVEEFGTKQASIALLLEKALLRHANVRPIHFNQIDVYKILVLTRKDLYSFTLHQVLIIVWPV